jgi:predicted dienelactone hydrolase
MAAAGAVVLSPEHKAQSRADLEEAELFRFYRRPTTLSAHLDWILADKRFAGILDTARIFVVGHSVGGHSALLLAGARYDLDVVLERGRSQSQRDRLAARMAKAYAKTPPSAEVRAANGLGYRDLRIRRAVLLDPVPVYPGFTDASLKALDIPILYVGCSRSEIFDSDAVKAALAGLIPLFQSQETRAGHFVFAEEGTWLGRLIRPSVFRDPEGIGRAGAHDKVYEWITDFLDLGAAAPAPAVSLEEDPQ